MKRQAEKNFFSPPTILDKIKWNSKPPSPPNQGWSRAKGKPTRHFPILDLGGGGGLGFPFILSKIVDSGLVHTYPDVF